MLGTARLVNWCLKGHTLLIFQSAGGTPFDACTTALCCASAVLVTTLLETACTACRKPHTDCGVLAKRCLKQCVLLLALWSAGETRLETESASNFCDQQAYISAMLCLCYHPCIAPSNPGCV